MQFLAEPPSYAPDSHPRQSPTRPAGPPSRSSLPPPSIRVEQPPEAQPEAQRELIPQKHQPLLSVHRIASRSGNSPGSSILPLSIEQPRASGAPPEAASSLPLWSSPAQRELPQMKPPSRTLSQVSMEQQPRAAGGAPPEVASSLPLSSSPANSQSEQKQPSPPSLN